MARELIFSIEGTQYQTSPTKLDRKKLYGWTEVLALDDNGDECKLVSMDDGGTTIIPKGGMALGILSPDGKWMLRSELKAVNPDNSPATLIPSSYGTPIDLTQKVTAEEFLDYSIVSFYELEADEALIKAVANDIYMFTYCYRDSYEGSKAFIMASGEGDAKKLFMLVGSPNIFEYVALSEMSILEEEIEEEEVPEDGDIDFSMF